MTQHPRARGTRRRMTIPIALVLCLPAGACDFVDGLLDVEAPSDVIAPTLEDPSNAPLLVESTIADFECALAFYIMSGGLISDELRDTQLAAATWDYDRRGFADGLGAYATNTCNSTGNIFGVYTPVSTARWTADNVLRNLELWTDEEVPNRTDLIAQAAAYSGYSHILLGEGFCSAAVDGGPELQPADVFRLAEQRFTTAIDAATTAGLDDIRNMALVGRARARLNLGEGAEAAADAGLVSDGFVKVANYSTASSRSGNHVFRWNNRFNWASVDEVFYGDLEFGGTPDPRVDVENSGLTGADAFSTVYIQNKYPTESSPIPIATWEEAQLIIAEVEGGATAVGIINELHARAGLPAYGGGTEQEIQAHVREERRRALFLEGHRIHDIIRHAIPLVPAPGTVYPIKGGTYGSTTCLLLPEIERQNNPNID
ncbi:MAG: RagB/SusD family nutrient uptake outer membrane protein [Longimicrobiales bacterium]